VIRGFLPSLIEDFERCYESVFACRNWDKKDLGMSRETTQGRGKSEVINLLEIMKPEILWRHVCELAGLSPQEVIGRFDKTVLTENEDLAAEVLLASLKEQFKAAGVTDAVVEASLESLAADIGLA
jgi:hypothetical protein